MVMIIFSARVIGLGLPRATRNERQLSNCKWTSSSPLSQRWNSGHRRLPGDGTHDLGPRRTAIAVDLRWSFKNRGAATNFGIGTSE